jgi:hypothetical protein
MWKSVTVARKTKNGGNETIFHRYNSSEFDLTKNIAVTQDPLIGHGFF